MIANKIFAVFHLLFLIVNALGEKIGDKDEIARFNFSLDVGDCKNRLEEFTDRCQNDSLRFWQIRDEVRHRISDRQYCCSAWDNMLCIIERGRQYCNITELDHLIKNTIHKQKVIEKRKGCNQFNRNADYYCHFHWYYYMLSVVFVVFTLSLVPFFINMIRNNHKQAQFGFAQAKI